MAMNHFVIGKVTRFAHRNEVDETTGVNECIAC